MLILIRKKIMLYNTLLSYYYPTGLRWYIYIYIYFFFKKKVEVVMVLPIRVMLHIILLFFFCSLKLMWLLKSQLDQNLIVILRITSILREQKENKKMICKITRVGLLV